MHILFVDDTKDTREMYAYFFALKGFQTETAENGLEAVAAVRCSEEPFDAVVLDIEMPIMNGGSTRSDSAIATLPTASHHHVQRLRRGRPQSQGH